MSQAKIDRLFCQLGIVFIIIAALTIFYFSLQPKALVRPVPDWAGIGGVK